MAGVSPARPLFLATNSQDKEELRRLPEMVLHHFGAATRLLQEIDLFAAIPPEARPVVELLIAADATSFVGNAISTFSMNILMERDVLGKHRNSTIFQGLGSVDSWG
ncbi:unnamed protein product [Symbiodinium natans]|uniref:Uncharacterized protein n=1 Tax=Symbiodinium natans TaxID=878477 RepID=A0A812L977_9DINO|nr:unnamed protein product [Symbiodinium natans]